MAVWGPVEPVAHELQHPTTSISVREERTGNPCESTHTYSICTPHTHMHCDKHCDTVKIPNKHMQCKQKQKRHKSP